MKQLLSLVAGSAIVAAVLVSCGGGSGSDRETDSTTFESTQRDRTYTEASDSNAATAPLAAETNFINKTVEANYAELGMAKLASEKATGTEVKQIAKMLEDDHTVALNGLQQIAIARSITVPAGETEEAKQDIASLSEKKGKDFDKTWCKEMIGKHEKSIKNLEEMEGQATDPQLKTWIAETLPKIRIHRDKLVECHDKMK